MIRALLLAAALAAPAADKAVDPSLAGPVPTTLKGYLASDALSGQVILGPPPAPDSPQGRADRTIYLETRDLAGSPRWKQATQDNDIWSGGALGRYACALGRQVGPRATPATYRLLQRVELDARTVGAPPKTLYNRTRPLIGDERPVCIARMPWMATNASYPSGHAMVGWAWGLILGEMVPAKASGVLEAGRAVGDSRVICGVHYQSDVEAGRMLGAAMVSRMHAEPAFRRDLAAARAELARPGAAPVNCGA
ncbi:MAG: phosphatase PAP2 family protein [Phenylobacterium sp.]